MGCVVCVVCDDYQKSEADLAGLLQTNSCVVVTLLVHPMNKSILRTYTILVSDSDFYLAAMMVVTKERD
jgi:hypothetical protein